MDLSVLRLFTAVGLLAIGLVVSILGVGASLVTERIERWRHARVARPGARGVVDHGPRLGAGSARC